MGIIMCFRTVENVSGLTAVFRMAAEMFVNELETILRKVCPRQDVTEL